LPPPTAQNYSLRNRPHNRQLPDYVSGITGCNFTVRMLYRNIYRLLCILASPALCFILVYNCGLTVRNKRIRYVIIEPINAILRLSICVSHLFRTCYTRSYHHHTPATAIDLTTRLIAGYYYYYSQHKSLAIWLATLICFRHSASSGYIESAEQSRTAEHF